MLNWYRGMRTWACEQRMLWWTVVVLLAALAYVLWSPAPASEENRIRYGGTVLQLLGVATVWWGFEKTRKLFGFEYTPIAFWRWLRRAPLSASRRNITVALHGQAISATGGRVHLSVSTTDKSIEARLKVLEQNVAAMEARFAADIGDLGKRIQALSQAHDQRTQEHSARLTTVERQLLAAQTGGLDLSLSGLVWLMAGTVLVSIPDEIALAFGS